MLDNTSFDLIYKKRCHNITYFFRTTKYFSKDRAFSEGINAIIKNAEINFSFFKKVTWFFFKHLIIAFEISKYRKDIFKMLFNENANTFSEYQFRGIINNASNWWLDTSYAKIHLFIDFCNELFNDNNICGDVCHKANCTRDEYYSRIRDANNIMKSIENEYFDLYLKENAIHLEKMKRAMKKPTSTEKEQQAKQSAKQYVDSFEDNGLLENCEV